MPTVILYTVAAFSLFFSLWCTIITSALGRMTRTEAAEYFTQHGKSGAKIMDIMNRRPAATVGLACLRIISMATYGITLSFALLHDLPRWWQVITIYSSLTVISALLFAAFRPLSFGISRHIRVISRTAWWVAPLSRFFAIITAERDITPEETEARQENQLAVMLERMSESEAIEDNERDILQSLFDMGETRVREVMVPRTDIIAIKQDASLDKALSLFTRSGYSRVPVYKDSIDHISGILYVKDVIRRIHRRNADNVSISDLMRKPVFIPETKLVDDVLREMQADQVHIDIVVDEYGGIAGLVTIEDLVEELVGEISDEHDRSESEIEEIEPGVYRIPARTPVDDVGKLFGMEWDDDDVDTVGGLLTKHLGRVPIAESRAIIEGIDIEADRFEGRRRRLATVIAKRAPKERDEREGE